MTDEQLGTLLKQYSSHHAPFEREIRQKIPNIYEKEALLAEVMAHGHKVNRGPVPLLTRTEVGRVALVLSCLYGTMHKSNTGSVYKHTLLHKLPEWPARSPRLSNPDLTCAPVPSASLPWKCPARHRCPVRWRLSALLQLQGTKTEQRFRCNQASRSVFSITL